jgi:competence protein ComEA
MTPRRPLELGTPSQRRGLMVLLGILIVVLAIRLWLNPAMVPEHQPPQGPKAEQLADRIDPNIATEAELAAISGLGEKRAEAIVDYRQRYVAEHPNHLAFSRSSDLERISGIGPATAEMMEPYLIFPDKPPQTSATDRHSSVH